MQFNIAPVSDDLTSSLQKKIDEKTKPVGALGSLESLALQIGRIQNTLNPTLDNPVIAVFAGDHGISVEKVSAYPSEVTPQMVLNFLGGGAAINVFARLHDIQLKIIDAGVDFDFDASELLIDAKVARGTRNYLREAAMSAEQCEQAVSTGAELVSEWHRDGCNVIGFGEMGIANTSAAALLTSIFGRLPLGDCVGAGTGLTGSDLEHKLRILTQSRARLKLDDAQASAAPLSTLAEFGGFEIAMICGGMLRAAEKRMLILVDGFISTSAFMVARATCADIRDYCVFSHCSAEQGHRVILDGLGIEPLLDLHMRLGEGTGAAVAYPIVKAAVNFLNDMSSFSDARVSDRVDAG
jgi:nicotinate-nucleotide--dimethylbenzimidazole phosphoribosyltransferase